MKSIQPILADIAIKEKFQDIIDNVSNGGSLINLCALWNIRYSDMMRIIRADDILSKRYNQALKDREEWAKERILKEVQSLSMFNIKDIFNLDGTLKKPAEMPPEFTAAIKEVTADGDIKFIDKLKALDLYHKQMGLFVDKKEISGTLSLETLIKEAHKLATKE